MAGGGASVAHWQLHRLLLWRIAGTALLLAALVYLIGQERTRGLAVDLAVQRAAEITAVAGTALVIPGAAQRGEVQARLDAKEPLSLMTAMGLLEQSRGTHFDPQLLDAFARIAGPLHAAFANREDEHPQQELKGIVVRYFQQSLDVPV